ncbi:UNVERIFIED_CONTAM: hypothetical protein NCL1_36936 [Trichonephila clavipes]
MRFKITTRRRCGVTIVIVCAQQPTAWPPGSPDMNPCHFWVWEFLKAIVYRGPITFLSDLKNSIERHVPIEKVNELYTNREKMKRRKKKKVEDEEEIISLGSSYLFVDEKLTIKERIKKLLGLLKESASDTDSMKETTDKSEEGIKRSTSIDELSSLPEVKIIDVTKTRQTSEESSDSPKLADSHSKLSLLQDSPTRTHDTLSRLSLLQDSPPNYGIMTLLQDTPPSHQAKKSDQESIRVSESGKPILAKKKTESQESQDSEQSNKKQESIDSDKSSHMLKQKSDSQGSDENKVKKSKSDSQDSENGKCRKQKSDSQESNDSFDNLPKIKNKKIFEPLESKLTRRESIGGYSGTEGGHKWRKSPSGKTKNESKVTKSLDVNLSPNC